jgi:gamma-glutamyltranspeptidase / glutathione hydrolase
MPGMIRRLASLVALVVLVTCKRDAPPPPPAGDPAAWSERSEPRPAEDAAPSEPHRTDTTRDPIDEEITGTARTYMVASESADATRVGRDILAAGGNAVDAAIATAFALAVTHPTAGNLGGGGFAIVRSGKGKAVALDFREVAPAAATPTMFVDAAGQPTGDSVIGHRASGVPGSVAGLWELHRRFGKKPWRELVAPAIRLARDGFAVDNELSYALSNPRSAEKLKRFPATAAIWFDSGMAHGAGTTVQIPELAATLERIAARGRDGFYKGETAQAIAQEMQRGGGLITAADLAAYRAIWREPLRFGYRGRSIVSMPPPSSGGVVLAMTAGMLRDLELGKLAWYGADHVHRIVEIWKRGFATRNQLLGDPAFVRDMPLGTLLAQDYLDRLAAQLGPRATPAKDVPALLEGEHTTHLCVVDASGMAVSLTTTLNGSFGSGVTVGGFLLNNEMDDFTTRPGAPNMFGLVQGEANQIEPGKRMLSSMAPTIVEDERGDVVLLAGAGGGPRIITAVWQTISNVVDFDKPIDVAVARARIHHQHLPDRITVQAEAIDRATAEALRAMGHELAWTTRPRELAHVTAIVRTADGLRGTADPRNGGAAMGD